MFVATLSFAKRPDVRASLIDQPWDLVVVDDAHDGTSASADLVETLRDSPGNPAMLFVVSSTASDHNTPAGLEVIDWTADVRRFMASVAPGAEVIHRVVSYARSAEEKAVFAALGEYVTSLDPRVRTTLLRRAASSIASLEQTLFRIASRDDVRDSTFEDLLDQVEELDTDSKLTCFCSLLLEELPAATEPVVVFTDFRDTLEYVAAAIEDQGVRAHRLHSGLSLAARETVMAELREGGGVLVTTAGSTEGLSLSLVRAAVHYDLPLSPQQYEQRVGRYNRFGRTTSCTSFTLRDSSGALPLEDLQFGMIEKHESRALEFGRDAGIDHALSGLLTGGDD